MKRPAALVSDEEEKRVAHGKERRERGGKEGGALELGKKGGEVARGNPREETFFGQRTGAWVRRVWERTISAEKRKRVKKARGARRLGTEKENPLARP